MVIITGPGRCGTSMMSLYCHEIGLNVDIGPRLALLDAGYESASSMVVNQSFIKHYHLKISLDHVNYHEEKIKAVNFDVVKDPLFVCYSPCIEHWWRFRQDLIIFYMTRDSKEIVASQKRHPEMNTPTYRCFSELIEKKESEFLATVKKLHIPIIEFIYPDQIRFDLIYPFFKSQYNKLQKNDCKRIWNKVIRLQNAKIVIGEPVGPFKKE